ncbi:CENP-C_C domain-containing protein [Trichonephila inaurata madagascariensis]|uniref:CENP-C_C domain-containing protein n=1 Tax=Trichonephila inaurata madagascariensis TaxID=2747483 RepID=A0A8X7CJQ0_9ARAC|nr:CENP-C_C domain-containing protein [Trichonephila inaurata madagascariensis]
MKGKKRKPCTSNIGRRSGLDVVSRKRIRAQEDGTDVFADYWSDSDSEISKITNTSFSKVVNDEEIEESVRESQGNVLDIHKRTYDDELSTFLPDKRDKRVSKAREWLSASFAGSVKSFGKHITPKISRDKAVNTSFDKSQKSARKDHRNVTFQPYPSIEKLISEREPQIDVSSKNISNNKENLNRITTLSDSTKDTRQIIKIQKNYTEKSDSDTSTVEEFPLMQRSNYVTSKNDQHTRMLTPKKQLLTQNDIDNNDFSEVRLSSVKKTKKRKLRIISDYDSDSSSEVSRSVADELKSRRHSSVATLPVRESPQIERSFSNVNKASTPKDEVSHAKSAKQSLIKKSRVIVDYSSDSSSEKSDEVSRIKRRVSFKSDSINASVERQMEESQVCKNLFQLKNVVNRCSEQLPMEGRTAISAKASRLEKSPSKLEQSPVKRGRSIMPLGTSGEQSPSKPEQSLVKRGRSTMPLETSEEQSPITRGRSTMSIEASRQKKSPSKSKQSPVRRGRSRKSLSKPEQSPVTRRSRMPIEALSLEKSLSKPEQSAVMRRSPRMSVEAPSQEKIPSKLEQSPVMRGRPRMPVETSRQKKSPSKLEQSPVRRGRSRKSLSEPEQSPVTRRPRMSIEAPSQEKSPSELEQSPVMRGRPRMPIKALRQEKSPSKPEQSSIRKGSPRTYTNNSRLEKSLSKLEQSPVRRGRSRISVYQSKPEKSSSVPEELSVKRKRPRLSIEHFGPEASVIESETSPKKITQVIGDQVSLSKQKKISAKVKGSKNKRVAPVDNKEVLSGFEENSMPILKRKENRVNISAKNNRHQGSEKSSKRPISHTQDQQSKEVSSKGNISEPANGLRRSSRYRVPPLDIWRNERLVFETLPSGEVKCSIDKGSEEDNYGLLKILRRTRKMKSQIKKSQKKKSVRTVENTSILDTKTGGIVHALVHRPFESLHWSVPPNEVKKPPPYLIAKAFTAKSISFGFLDVSPFSTKEAQYSPVYNLHFAVIKGIVDVIIHETKFTFEKGDSFIVPVGAPYSVKNCSPARALLSFSTFKEPIFPHQIEG